MSQLCFATFARALQKVLIQLPSLYNTPTGPVSKQPSTARPKRTATDTYVVETLLAWTQEVLSIQDKEGWEVWRTSKTVSSLLNQKIELHTGYGPLTTDKDAYPAALKAFQAIKKQIQPLRRDDFTAELVELIKDDPEVSEKAAEQLLQVADQESEEAFWAMTFMSAISRPNIKRADPNLDQVGVLLAIRSGDVCPGCDKEPLFKKVRGKRKPLFDVVSFPLTDDGEDEVQEAVCAQCAKLLHHDSLFIDKALITKLRRRYQDKQESAALQESMLDAQLDDEISRIINTLGDRLAHGDLPAEEDPDALPIKEKIRPENYLLSILVTKLVLTWYHSIEQDFRAMEGKRKNPFSAIAYQVAKFYDSIAKHSDDQQKIFDAVRDWIHVNSESTSLDASAIVAAFFVQNCEVFDEIA